MWFKNLCLYRLPKNWEWAAESEAIEEQLAARMLQGCSATDLRSIGWIEPRRDGRLIYSVNRQWLLALGVEEKLLPSSIVKRFAMDRAMEIEETQGRRVGRREMRDLIEAMTLELLPRAFVRGRTTHGWIDRGNGWLVVDAASPAKADEFLEILHKSVDRLPTKALKVATSPTAAMTAWITAGEAPAGFTIDQELELRSPDRASVRYLNHSPATEEISQHIADGMFVARLALTWHDRISFVLNDLLQIKRLVFLDILKEQNETQEESERFDLDFTLMTGEVASMLDDLLAVLGGEQPAS